MVIDDQRFEPLTLMPFTGGYAMALIECPECLSKISDSAPSCPHCGFIPAGASRRPKAPESKKAPRARPFFAVLQFILFAFIGLLAYGAIFKSKPAPAITSTAPTVEPALLQAPKETIPGKIGDTVTVGDFVYRVQEIAFVKSINSGPLKRTADGIFLAVRMTIKNTGRETRTLDHSMFKLTNSSGVEYEHSATGTWALETLDADLPSLLLKQCQPGIKTKGSLVFEVPTKKDLYHLKVSGGAWSGRTGDIALVK